MLPVAPFGRTGHASTRVIFGAAALGAMSQERADTTLALVARRGINHIDTAASYGASEDRLHTWLRTNRDDVFLATKTGERHGTAARKELERSLERMGVDHVDLIQLHNLVEEDEWETAFSRGGAVEALERARDEGLCRHIGVTGHGVRIAGMHRRSIERFDCASVLLPVNYTMMSNPLYRHDVEELREACADRDIAFQTIKSIARGRWPERNGREFSWYEPLDDAAAIGRAVRYVLGNSQQFLNTTSDARLLPMVIDAAEGDMTSPDDAELQADVERFGITPLFDGAELERI